MASSSSSSASAAAAAAPTPPPPSAAKKGFLRRVLPFLLAANFAVGVYVLARTWNKGSAEKDEVSSPPVESKETAVSEKTVSTESLPPLAKAALPPIPEHEQRELYKWILEEKRKVKPRDSAEKKKIDEEKALLKQVLRAESIPSL